jgi:hypothetical protein
MVGAKPRRSVGASRMIGFRMPISLKMAVLAKEF